MTVQRPASSVDEVLARHVERTRCDAPLRGMVCDFDAHHPIHDLYRDIAKRDPLNGHGILLEDDRHEYQGGGRGVCDADEDDWPCAAHRLASELVSA